MTFVLSQEAGDHAANMVRNGLGVRAGVEAAIAIELKAGRLCVPAAETSVAVPLVRGTGSGSVSTPEVQPDVAEPVSDSPVEAASFDEDESEKDWPGF